MNTVTTPSPGYQRAAEWARSGPKRLLIGGEWVMSKSGKTFESINPATEEVLCQVAEADRADVDAAVAAARRAYEAPSWLGASRRMRERARC